MAAPSAKEAQQYLIDPMNAPEPSAETGPGTSFGSTMPQGATSSAAADTKAPRVITQPASSTSPLGSRNPFRDGASPTSKNGTTTTTRDFGTDRHSSPKERFPDHRTNAFGGVDDAPRRRSGDHPPSYDNVTSSSGAGGPSRRRGSSLRERYPGDMSAKPLDVLRRDSKKAHRSPHLNKRHLPGADMVDKLDPAIGGRAYHHEGPYDAALLARNTDPKYAPVAAVAESNAEALKATPRENIKDAVERHQPLDGTSFVPPGEPDRFGRVLNYQEGTDLMREPGAGGDAGYNKWPGKDYDPEDLKGQAEPGFSLDRALKAHKIDDNGIEMTDRSGIDRAYHEQERKGLLDSRDPVAIAGNDSKYVDLQNKNMGNEHEPDGVKHSGSMGHAVQGLKKRIGSLRHRKESDGGHGTDDFTI